MSMSMASHDCTPRFLFPWNDFVPFPVFSSNVPFFQKHDFYYQEVFLSRNNLTTFLLYTFLLFGSFFFEAFWTNTHTCVLLYGRAGKA
jgi:hypothetical protein